MLPSRGILQAGLSTRAVLQAQAVSRSARHLGHGRHFGTSLRSSGAGLGLKTGATVGTLRRSAIAGSVAIGGPMTSRRQISFTSLWSGSKPTTAETAAPLEQAVAKASALPPPVPEVHSTPLVPEASIPEPPLLDLSTLDLETTSILNIPEQIGYLKTLGIDFGWGPSSMVQWTLEHIHVYTGLPWWGSIAATALLIRVILLRPLVIAQETSAKMQVVGRDPRYAAAKQRMHDGVAAGGDKTMMLQSRQEINLMHKEYGVRPLKALYGLLQIPLGYGMFRVLNSMGKIPVPGFEEGGALWFQNLSIPDPYFILPLLGPAMMFATFRAGRNMQTPEQAAQMKLMMYVIGPISVLVTMWLPGAVQWYFFVASALGLAQTTFFQNARARIMLGLPPLPNNNAPTTPPPSAPTGSGPLYQPPTPKASTGVQGIVEGFKETVHKAKGGSGNYVEANKKKAALTEAQQYQEKRAAQERQKFLAKIKEKKLR